MTDPTSSIRPHESSAAPSFVRASDYSFAELARIYNQTRIDYLVPMAMDVQRMEAYVRHYDIHLEASFVAVSADAKEMGIGMLGLREERAWITRLGIMPDQRGHNVGQLLVNKLIETAREKSITRIQLEVIEANIPGHRLFLKVGFEELRRLLVIQRSPGDVNDALNFEITQMKTDEIRACLAARLPGASWIEETASLFKLEHLIGLRVRLPSGAAGWIVFSETLSQLSHLVFSGEDKSIALALLHAVHHQYPRHETQVENLPVNSPLWPIFQRVGYVESFRRIEMRLLL